MGTPVNTTSTGVRRGKPGSNAALVMVTQLQSVHAVSQGPVFWQSAGLFVSQTTVVVNISKRIRASSEQEVSVMAREVSGEVHCPFCQRPMQPGQMWVAGKGQLRNLLRIDWASPDKELKSKVFTRSKQADKTLFSADRQGMSSPAVEAFHCSICDAMVAKFSNQTSDD